MAAQCDTDSPHNPLWDFALALYDRLGVKDVLLRLQDEADMDVLILLADRWLAQQQLNWPAAESLEDYRRWRDRSEEHTSELQSREKLGCRLLLEKKNE